MLLGPARLGASERYLRDRCFRLSGRATCHGATCFLTARSQRRAFARTADSTSVALTLFPCMPLRDHTCASHRRSLTMLHRAAVKHRHLSPISIFWSRALPLLAEDQR